MREKGAKRMISNVSLEGKDQVKMVLMGSGEMVRVYEGEGEINR